MTTTTIHSVPISAFIQYSSHPVPMLCSSGTNVCAHPVPMLYSSNTYLCARLVPDIVRNFGMLLEENWRHGFCPEQCLPVDTCVTIHPYHMCGPPSQGK
jgi:hypothetical protein